MRETNQPERDDMIDQVARSLRVAESLDPSFDASVMARVRVEPVPARESVWTWLREPRTLTVSPLAGLALAACLVAITVAGVSLSRHADSMAASSTVAEAVAARLASAGPDTSGLVQFVLVAPTAARVSVVGDFNDWNPAATPLARATGNVWTVRVPLAPGRYNYTFVVDGVEWVPDPTAPRAAGDGFGHPNSLLTVAGAGI